jgi:CDP-diacylglycerol---serine O-phosphatidyltransferase
MLVEKHRAASHIRSPVVKRLISAIPHMVTLAALGCGMTAITLSFQNNFPQAIGCILLAAVLDACDGRIARHVGVTSRFGAELDSLSDVICFGAAPALLVYSWGLEVYGWVGWLVCLALAMAAALRLARFNVAALDDHKPVWSVAFFQGVPSPAGAFVALLPVFMESGGILNEVHGRVFALAWLPFVSFLMISNLPTFSGKLAGRILWRASPAVLFYAFLVVLMAVQSSLWAGLVVLALTYLSTFPFSLWRHRVLQGRA